MGSNNYDCVTVFRTNEGDKDIQSVALTLKSMSDKTIFGKLPDWFVPDPEPLDSVMRPIDCLSLPTQADYTNDNDEIITSNISDDCSDIIPVDESIKQYLMKGGIYILKHFTSKTFDFSKEFHTRELLESMNEKWKIQVIISFLIYRKININGFIDWYLWIKNLFSYEVVNQYNILIDDQNR